MTTDTTSITPVAAARRRLLTSLLRAAVDSLFPALRLGALRVQLPDGSEVLRKGHAAGPYGHMRIERWRGLFRLLRGEPGFVAGYLAGDWSTPDLQALLEVMHRNGVDESRLARDTLPGRLAQKLAHRLRANTRRGSRRNIRAHYDLGNAFYAAWLDEGMNYSSALYEGAATLEEAQSVKLERVADLLELSGDEQILEIGCGWGALAEHLLARGACRIEGVTLSERQLAYARERLAGNARAEFRLKDYRAIASFYDRVVSIEMLEAVGERYWPVYFDTLRRSLRPGGVAVLQVITIDETLFEVYRHRPDFIQQHIFPGGMLPTASIVRSQAVRAGLELTEIQPFGASYVRTLQEWRRRFVAAWPTLMRQGFDARFKRLWEYYLAYCETGFRTGAIDVKLFKFKAQRRS